MDQEQHLPALFVRSSRRRTYKEGPLQKQQTTMFFMAKDASVDVMFGLDSGVRGVHSLGSLPDSLAYAPYTS
jgi:hypothetical protein